jgi:hypothetical protein
MNTLLGALQFTLRGAGVWLPGPTLHNPAYINICIVQNSYNMYWYFNYTYSITTPTDY